MILLNAEMTLVSGQKACTSVPRSATLDMVQHNKGGHVSDILLIKITVIIIIPGLT